MWLFFKGGFYSIVQKGACKDDEVIVRGRCRDDSVRLRRRLLAVYGFDAKIIDTPDADYACQIYVPKEIMAEHMAQSVIDIDYGNFKATISGKDKLRHDAYFDCWDAMYRWQEKMDIEELSGSADNH